MNNNVLIIFIPGIMGSTLKKRNRLIWPWSDYILDSYEYLKKLEDKEIYSSKIEPFTYRKLMNNLKGITTNVISFHYDWRQNNLSHVKDLKEKISEKSEQVDEIILVAHSMGGIIGKLLLNQLDEEAWADKISKFITLGTPWNGAMDAYKTLKYGTSIPDKIIKIKGAILNKKTSKEISPYFPSIYQLLPNENYCELASRLETKTLVSYRKNNRNYYDHEEFFIDHLKNDFEFYKHKYNDVFEDFHSLLSKDIPQHIQHFEIIGISKPTISGITENTLGEAEGDFRNGDGTVPLFSALSNSQNAYFVNKVGHQDLPKNGEVIQLVENIINNVGGFVENETIFNSLSSQYNKKFSGKILKVACPVEISLVDKEGQVIYGAIETIDEEGLKEIVNTEYNIEEIGETTYIVFDDDEGTIEDFEKIMIHAYDKGPTTVSIDEYEEGENVKRNAFKVFEINPDIEAELILSSNIEENKLSIEEFGKEPVAIESSVEVLVEDIEYPSTKMKIFAERSTEIGEQSETIIAKGYVKIAIDSIEKGSYEIDSTFIKVNGKLMEIKLGEEISLDLKERNNRIEYFTKDIFGNVEAAKKIEIILLPKFSFNVNIEFLPHQYIVEIEFKEFYRSIAEQFGKEIGEYEIVYDNDSKRLGNDVFYINKTRNIEIKYNNILGEEEHYCIAIDENIITSIFEGTAEENNLKDLINKYFQLESPKIHFIMPEEEGRAGYFRKINNWNITNCTDIIIEKDPLNVKIAKYKKYKIYLQNFSEDIVMNAQKVYPFKFKVIDTERQKDMRTLELQIFSKVKGLKEIILTDTIDVYFNEKEDVYVGDINLEEVNDIIKQNWKKDAAPVLEVNISEKITRNSLRSQDIDISIEN
ncbi:lipase/acyltransferase domain-containing protein [Bacillus toyonensis]|uniref:lipase/acyltransferase domain-containing protein n=3 Tax=Bacillus toyonensis TaxID=155322 RepID=UPI0035E3A565